MFTSGWMVGVGEMSDIFHAVTAWGVRYYLILKSKTNIFVQLFWYFVNEDEGGSWFCKLYNTDTGYLWCLIGVELQPSHPTTQGVHVTEPGLNVISSPGQTGDQSAHGQTRAGSLSDCRRVDTQQHKAIGSRSTSH